MKYTIGIDSGATKSEVLTVPILAANSARPASIKTRNFPGINFNVMGFDETAKRLINIIRRSAEKIKLSNVEFICIGLSGARFEKDREKLRRKISSAIKFRKIKIYPDTEIAFASIFEPGEKNCGIFIAGTGSVLYYRNSTGAIKKIGGWGRHFGDEGSGYWIAREAFHKITQGYDRRHKNNKLARAIEKEFSLTESNIIKRTYHSNFEISKAARLVFRAAEKGDRISKNIISNASEHLAEHFKPLGKGKYRISLCGSLFTEEKLLEKELRKITKKNFKNVKLIKPASAPVWGAVRLGVIASINEGR